MKKSVVFTTVMVFSVVAFSAAACGNKAQADENRSDGNKAENAASHEGHDHPASVELKAAKTPVKNGFKGMPAPGTKAYCPIMDSDFQVKADSEFSEYKGKTYVFCCPGCKPKFEEDPEKYIKMI